MRDPGPCVEPTVAKVLVIVVNVSRDKDLLTMIVLDEDVSRFVISIIESTVGIVGRCRGNRTVCLGVDDIHLDTFAPEICTITIELYDTQ